MKQGEEVEPMGDEELARLRAWAANLERLDRKIGLNARATLALLARLDATRDDSTILARDLDDALSRLHRAEKDRDAKAEALKAAATYLDALDDNIRANDADMRIDPCEAPSVVAARLHQALTTPPTEEESA